MEGSCVPRALERPRIVKVIGNDVTMTWTQPDSGGAEINGYRIAYTTVDGCMAQHVTVKTTTTAKLDEKFICGQSYVFAVAAKNAFGFGDFSPFSEEVKIPNDTGNYLRSFPGIV